MGKKRRTRLKNFRFSPRICTWLENKSEATGKSQSRLVLDALKNTYKIKDLP